jgi:CRISPR system Cascade subunit CasD
MDLLLLRLDAPLMSLGGPAVDSHRVVQRFPSLSLLTGLLANALGLDHREGERIGLLQSRLRYAVRCDRTGQPVMDYQTVDFSQSSFNDTGWTTRSVPELRTGGEASDGTHIRIRDLLADAVFTVALTLVPERSGPTRNDLRGALVAPARPLFIGRKHCVPSGPILLGTDTADSLHAGLVRAKRIGQREQTDFPSGMLPGWWPDEDREPPGDQILAVTDSRDWFNGIHVGQRRIRAGLITLLEAA